MKKKILIIIPSLSLANGVASYVMNYYRNIKGFEMDFMIVGDNIKTEYYHEIIGNGNKVFFIKSDSYVSLLKNTQKIKTFFKKNKDTYDIVHCNVANIGLIYLYYAKKYGVESRVLHSHATITSDKLTRKIRNDIIIPLTVRLANHQFACSIAAGKAMFKNKKFVVINNAIDAEKYKYSSNFNKELRKELKIDENTFVIGTVGRLCNQKNHMYLIDIINKIKEKSTHFKVIILGNGELKEKIENKIFDLGLKEDILIIESRIDAHKFYSLFNVFVLPSLYEGLPLVGVEAQINGVNCIFSKTITDEVNISGNSRFIGIDNEDIDNWCEAINEVEKHKNDNRESKRFSQYDIARNAEILEEKYNQIINQKKNK